MNIVVIVRTLNESRNIERFCECYSWVNDIIVSDGGSDDNTELLTYRFHNVSFYKFPDKVWMTDKIFINPRGKHINFLIGRALYHHADWVLFDDADSVPSLDLKLHGREILESCKEDEVFAYRLFVYGKDKYFPDMNIPGQSLWAWRSGVNVRADETSHTISMQIPQTSRLNLEPPYGLLHYFYPDEETLQKKKEAYVLTGEVSAEYDPIHQFGQLVDLPNWAKWR